MGEMQSFFLKIARGRISTKDRKYYLSGREGKPEHVTFRLVFLFCLLILFV